MKRCIVLFGSALTVSSLWAGGFGLGIQTAFDLGQGCAIAPRLEYLRITDSSTVGPISLSATDNIFSLGADFNYFFSGRTGKGFYVLGGLGLANGSLSVSGTDGTSSNQVTQNQTVLYPEGGAGYEFTRHVGLEVLYKALNFKDVDLAVGGVPVSYSYSNLVQIALTLRF